MIRIFTDFNARGDYGVPLYLPGSHKDILRKKIELREGLHVTVYDDTYQAEGIVHNTRGEWYARIVDGTGRPRHAEPTDVIP